MSEDAAQRPVVIFLSYRRGDTQWAARGIYDRLVDRYGRKNVFRDLDAIPPGARFRDYVEMKISESDVLILLIGNAWASYADETGRRRLEQPRDPVRLEVETALRLGLPIIPVRVEGAPMPTEGDLVPSIIDLLEFNAAEVSDSRWEYDVDKLLWAINETVERRGIVPPSSAAADSSARAPGPPRRRGAGPAGGRGTGPAGGGGAGPAGGGGAGPARRRRSRPGGRRRSRPGRRRRSRPGGTRRNRPGARRRSRPGREAEEQARRDAEDQARRSRRPGPAARAGGTGPAGGGGTGPPRRRGTGPAEGGGTGPRATPRSRLAAKAEEQARRDAEETGPADADRPGRKQARREAEEHARRDAEEQARSAYRPGGAGTTFVRNRLPWRSPSRSGPDRGGRRANCCATARSFSRLWPSEASRSWSPTSYGRDRWRRRSWATSRTTCVRAARPPRQDRNLPPG